MTQQARGMFEVELTPQTQTDEIAQAKLNRLSIAKHFSGDLEATSRGEMLSVLTDTEGSAGYVALERVTGKLSGRVGSFALQHSGTMTRGEGSLRVIVVPDSGTEELEGLAGSMTIEVTDGRHSYSFDYSLAN